VTALWEALCHRLADSRLARQALEVAFRASARRLLARLDGEPPERAQARALLGLAHQAQATNFGRQHDFRRIRTVADFRRLVHLTTLADLRRDYWPEGAADLSGTTWPALRPGTGGSPTSPALAATHRAALATALAFVAQARPHARLFRGRLLHLGEDGLSEAALRERFPALVRPYASFAAGPALDDVTCLIGPLERVEALVRQAGPWPGLQAVLHSRSSPGGRPEDLRALLGGEVLLLEMLSTPEGPLAVEDPRHGGLRLLTDHGLFFELLPEGGGERLGLAEVKIDQPCELVLSSPGGLWACRLGLSVSFRSLAPPVLHVLPARPTPPAADLVSRCTTNADWKEGLPAAPKVGHPLPPPRAPHRRSSDIPAALPERLAHSPWSLPVDQG
jgi:hypothetical protein